MILSTLCLTQLSSCRSNQQPIRIPNFAGGRAFEYLEKQAAFGPRVPGSASSEQCRKYLISFFDSIGAVVDTMLFVHNDKTTGKPIRMVNIVAHFKGYESSGSDTYLVTAHYDSRPRADQDLDSTLRSKPIPGADDGASGVAVLMELGNLFSAQRPRVNIDVAMLDGEDWGREGDLDEYFLGAKEMVLRGIKGKYKFALIIDMVGQKNLRVFREAFSQTYSQDVNNLIWKTASELGEKAFVDSVGYTIYDDHLSYLTIGLPAAVIIDFNYPYWHTTQDTPDKCSAESLEIVGKVVSTILYRL